MRLLLPNPTPVPILPDRETYYSLLAPHYISDPLAKPFSISRNCRGYWTTNFPFIFGWRVQI